jgi:hypothetical protein
LIRPRPNALFSACSRRERIARDGAQATLGYCAADVLGKPVDLFAKAEDAASRVSQRELREAQLAGRSVSARFRLAKDGRQLFMEGLISCVRDEDGTLGGRAIEPHERTSSWPPSAMSCEHR